MELSYDKSKKYLLACSGGPDSMALLDILRKNNFTFYVANVNYKTRKESDYEEMLVKEYCNKYDIPCFISIYKDNEEKKSFEVKAREFRYKFFKELYDKYHLDGVFVAHHKDDLIETYLLKKQRNVINESWIINEKSIVMDMLIIRPLLNYYKEDLLKYCQENNLKYSIDYTNFLPIHSRNVIRENLKYQDKEKIYQEAINEEKKLKEKQLEVQKFIKYNKHYEGKILKEKDDVFLSIFLHSIINEKYKNKVNKGLLKKLKEFISSTKPNLLEHIDNNYYLLKEYDIISFKEIDKVEYSYIVNSFDLFETPYFKVVNSGQKMQGIYVTNEDFPLIIRNFKKDDKIKLKNGMKKVSRLFIDKKVPFCKRNLIPIIENKNHEIIFVYNLYRKYGLKDIQNNFFVIQ